MSKRNLLKIGFLGMTHLGLNYAVASAEKGFSVICYDKDNEVIRKLNNQKLSIHEPGLEACFIRNRDKLIFVEDITKLSDCDLIFVAPDVPTDDSGVQDNSVVLTYLDYLEKLAIRNPVIVMSQVRPGFCRQHKKQLAQLYYQVETLIFGQALQRALYPERIIVGCKESIGELPNNYQIYLDTFKCPVVKMSYESAELTKIAINCYLAASVSVTNTLAGICEKIGAAWKDIRPALELDKRIGKHAYLSPGMGISGGNIERDLETVTSIGSNFSLDVSVIKGIQKNSLIRKNWVLDVLQQEIYPIKRNLTIGILGATYKPGTKSTKNSPCLALLPYLKGHKINLFDQYADLTAECFLQCNIAKNIEQACKGADVLIIMTAWEEFKKLTPTKVKQLLAGRIVIDPFEVLDKDNFARNDFIIYSIGEKLPGKEEVLCFSI